MIEATSMFGLIIFAGLFLIFIKLPRMTALRLLGHHLWLDIGVTVLTLVMHWGTMTGLMSAALAGLICSIFTSGGRKLFGFIRGQFYYPGIVNLAKVDNRGTWARFMS